MSEDAKVRTVRMKWQPVYGERYRLGREYGFAIDKQYQGHNANPF
jgi:hypothetical protein